MLPRCELNFTSWENIPICFYHNIQAVQKHSLCIFFYSTVPAQNVSHFARREFKKHEIYHYMMSLVRSLRARSPFGDIVKSRRVRGTRLASPAQMGELAGRLLIRGADNLKIFAGQCPANPLAGKLGFFN